MEFLSFYACMKIWFWMWRLTLTRGVLFLLVCRILCSNVRGLAGNLRDLTVAFVFV